MRKKEERLEKQMNEVMSENRRLIEPLQKAKDEVHELQRQVTRNAIFTVQLLPQIFPYTLLEEQLKIKWKQFPNCGVKNSMTAREGF